MKEIELKSINCKESQKEISERIDKLKRDSQSSSSYTDRNNEGMLTVLSSEMLSRLKETEKENH